MGVVGAALAAFGIIQAGNQMSAGYAARGDAQVNAANKMYEAGMVDIQKEIESGQFLRQKNMIQSKIMARSGASGLAFSGTPMAVFTDVSTQLELDNLITQFNFDLQKTQKLAEAEAYRRQGRLAVKTARMEAFSTFLQTVAMVAMRLPKGTKAAGGVPTGKTIQYGGKSLSITTPSNPGYYANKFAPWSGQYSTPPNPSVYQFSRNIGGK